MAAAEAMAHATWEEEQAYMFVSWVEEEDTVKEYTVNNVVQQHRRLLPSEVLLDNQANISVIHPMLLEDVRQADRKIKVNGVGGVQLIVEQTGRLPEFFNVYASTQTKANVLSFAEVEDKYKITYLRREAFVVHMAERDLVFSRRDKLYVADWYQYGRVEATVMENERLYSKEEVWRAKEAHEFIKNSGYPSAKEATHTLRDGNVQQGPMLTAADLERAYKIYGLHPEYVRGKLTKKVVGRPRVDMSLRQVEKALRVYADVMHVDAKKFFVTVSDPLNLTLQCGIENESCMSLGMALQGQLALLRTRGFVPTVVYTDPHSSFRSMTQDFPGVEIDIGGAGDYVAKVDAKIRHIKETYMSVKSGLMWDLPRSLIGDLVAYAVSRMNIRRTNTLAESICPRVLFTGIPVDYKKELLLAFGDYVEAYECVTRGLRNLCQRQPFVNHCQSGP